MSTTNSVDISIPFITANANGPLHLQKTLTRAEFEHLVEPLNERYVAPCKQALKDAGVKVDEVILVGGTTRIPSVVNKIHEIFGIEPSKGINPDEAVSLGAAIQGGVLAGEVKDILLLDVTPLTLGICVNENLMQPMIEKNTTIPCKKSNTFTTAVDNQPAVTIRISQGERSVFDANKILGQFNLDNIVPAPRGMPQIEVTFDIDANGILTVSAKDKGTGKEQHITITGSSGLTKDEIEKAKKDAELHADEDKKLVELATMKNQAESLCFSLEKVLKDSKDKLTDDIIKATTEKIASVRSAVASSDISKIKAAVDDLSDYNAKNIVPKIYPNGGQPGSQQMSKEDLERMMKDPKFAEMFKKNNASSTSANNGPKVNPDGSVDAEVVDGK